MGDQGPRAAPPPLTDVLWALRWWFRAQFVLAVVALVVILAVVNFPSPWIRLVVIAAPVVLFLVPAYMLYRAVIPPRRPDFLYLRQFKSDSNSLRLKSLLQVLIGGPLRIAGIRDPRRRMSVWLRPLLAPVLMYQYAHPAHMGLEAGDDWSPRLWSSMAQARGAFIDVRTLTEAVELEVRLCLKALTPDRVAFIVDESKAEAAWRERIAEVGGLTEDEAAALRLLGHGDEAEQPDSTFVQETQAFLAEVPDEPAGESEAGWALVADQVLSPSRRTAERVGLLVSIGVGLGILFGIDVGLQEGLGEKAGSVVSSAIGLTILVCSSLFAWLFGRSLSTTADIAEPIDPTYANALKRRRSIVYLYGAGPLLVLLFGVAAAIAGPKIVEMLDTSDVGTAETQLERFGTAVEAYRLEKKRLPEWLGGLLEPSDRTGEPFLEDIPDDPWGNAYEIRSDGRREYVISSYGPDGQSDTDDDIYWPRRDE